MSEKQIDEFIDWLGVLHLDFDNESKECREITKREIKEKLNEILKR